MSGDGKMLTVNWEARVGFECHFTHREARVALNEARVGGRITPAEWDRARKLLDGLFAGEPLEPDRVDALFLWNLIGQRTGLLPLVDSGNPHLYREQLDPGKVTELAVTEPV